MTETELKNRLKTITQPDEAARKAAHAHWASLAKPLGGLGDLEPLLEDVAALTGAPQFDFSKRAVLVLCADNGVIAQGISQSGSDVTRAVLQNLAQRKTSVCKMAETVHCGVIPVDMGIAGAPVNHPEKTDVIGVLSALGGLDIAGLCGVFLGGALENIPVIIDGFISSVAALCAARLCPTATKAMFASHVSAEPAACIVLEALGKKPLITANMHLGEGTGAVASLPLWDMALAVYDNCYSFTEGGIAPYTPQC